MLNSKVVSTLYFSNHRFLSEKKTVSLDYAKLEDRLKIQLKLTEEGSKVTEKFFLNCFNQSKSFQKKWDQMLLDSLQRTSKHSTK